MHRLCVAAIDIGTTHSCCVHSLSHRPNEVKVYTKWEGRHDSQLKVPTVVLFNKKKEFHSFGFEAVKHFSDLRNDEEKKRWYFFEGFHRITSDYTLREPELSDKSGKKLETYTVYGSIIKFFIERMGRFFRERQSPIDQRDIYVVITVPPTFTNSYKKMLEKAFLCAGLSDRYSFVRETEAVVSYWKHKWCKEREHPENLNLNNEDGFLLVNLRGRTATITAVTAKTGIIRQIHNVSGGGWGGQAVNEEFKQFLIKIVGAPVFLKFVEDEKEDWMDLEREFEIKKHAAKSEDDNKVSFKLPLQLRELYTESCNESVQDAVELSPYSRKIRFTGDRMRLDASILKDLFANTIEKVITNVNDVLQNEAVKGTKTIVMVGGFSDSPVVQDAVKRAFPDCHIFVPVEPAFTIIKGAVMEGHYTNPPKASVVSKFTYGFQLCHINDELECSVVEREETKVLIRKGDTVYEGDKVTCELTLEACDMEHTEIQFFASPRNETISADERDVEYLEKYRIDFDGVYTEKVRVDITFTQSSFERTVTVSGKSICFII